MDATGLPHLEGDSDDGTPNLSEVIRTDALRLALDEIAFTPFEDDRDAHEEEEEEEEYTEVVWQAFDHLDQVRPVIEAGPRWKLESFLDAVEVLRNAQEVFECSEVQTGVADAEQLMGLAMDKLLDEFEDALQKNSKPLLPELLRELAMTELTESVTGFMFSSRSVQPANANRISGGLQPQPQPHRHRHLSDLTKATGFQARAKLPSSTSEGGNGGNGRRGDLISPGSSTSSSSSRFIVRRGCSLQRVSGVPPMAQTSSPSSSGSSSPSAAHGQQGRNGQLSTAALVALQDWWPSSAIVYLQRMVRTLAKAGEGARCVSVYVKVRSEAVRKCIDGLRITPVDFVVLEILPWTEMEMCMRQWIKDLRSLVLVLLVLERALMEEMWDGLEADHEEGCLRLVGRSGLAITLARLLQNGSVMVSALKTPERLFALVDMFKTVRELRPHLEGVIKVDGMSEVIHGKVGFEKLPKQFAMAVMDTFDSFRSVLAAPVISGGNERKRSGFMHLMGRKSQQAFSEEIVPASGGVHPITSYVINYILFYLDRKKYYKGSLEFLYLEYCGNSDGKKSIEMETDALLGGLMENMEKRAELCPDDALAALFLLNNANYVQRQLLDSRGELLIELPSWKDSVMSERYARKFQTIALEKISSVLAEDLSSGMGSLLGGGEHREVKLKLKNFNAAFEELAIRQAGWIIPDEEWRKRTRIRMAHRLKEVYASFLLPHREELCNFRAYRYTPDSIERVVLDYFFLGTPTRLFPT